MKTGFFGNFEKIAIALCLMVFMTGGSAMAFTIAAPTAFEVNEWADADDMIIAFDADMEFADVGEVTSDGDADDSLFFDKAGDWLTDMPDGDFWGDRFTDVDITSIDMPDGDFGDGDIFFDDFDDKGTYVTISGVIKNPDGHPLQGVWVNAEGEFQDDCAEWMPGMDGEIDPMDDVDKMDDCFMEKFVGGGGETDENGEFTISVAQGYKYDLFVNTRGATDSNGLGGYFQDADGGSGTDPGTDGEWTGSTTNDWAERTVMEVGENGLNGITITLKTGSKIYGKAIDKDGTPVQDLWIDASSDLPGGWGGTSTDEAGNFSIIIPPGEGYRISAWPWKDGFIGGYWKAGDDSPLTTSGQDGSLSPRWNEATLVDATSDTEINIIFDAGHIISGRVTDEAGDPIPDIWVNAGTGHLFLDKVFEDEDGRIKEEYPEDELIFPEPLWYGASTDKEGNYEISVYPASDYRISVSGNGIYRTIYYKDASDWEKATPIDASNGDVTGIDFTLKMGPSLSGTLSGLKAGDTAHIEVWSESRWGWGNTQVTGTGSDVRFKIRGLGEGADYRINVWAEGYLNGHVRDDGTLGDHEEAALFEAGAEDVKIELSTGKTISGTLSGLSEGDRVWMDAHSDTVWSKGGTEVVAEGDTAKFTLSGLVDAKDFRIWVHAEGYIGGYYGGPGSVPVSWDQAVLVSTMDGDATGVDITMSMGNTISGTVTGLARGVYAYVNTWSDTAGSHGGTNVVGTGDDVTYEIKCLSPVADFRVYIQAEGHIGGYHTAEGTVSDWDKAEFVDASTNPIDINLALSKGKTISGTITGLGKDEWAWIEARREVSGGRWIEPLPVEEKAMMYSDFCGTGWGGEGNWGNIAVRGTGEPVRYTITGLASADDFIVTFRPEGYATEVRTGVDTSTDPDDVDFVVSEGKRISGTITGADTNRRVSVHAWSETTWDSGYVEVKPDADGKAVYEIKGLGNGADYVVSAYAGRMNLFYDQVMSWEGATRIDLSKESATGVNFAFDAIKMHTLSGTIAGLAADEKTFVWIDAWSKTGGWGNAELSGNGDFSMELPAGNYKIGVYADGYVKSFYDAESGELVGNWAAAGELPMDAGKNIGTLNLSAGYSISGVVTDSEGGTLPGVWVEVFNEDLGVSAMTSRKGGYRLSGLWDGTYTITLWSVFGYYEGEVTIAGSDVTHDISLEEENTGDMAGVVSPGDVVLLFDSAGNFVNASETDDDGNYAFDGLAMGQYTVKVKTEGKDDYDVLDTVTVASDDPTADDPDILPITLSNGDDPEAWVTDPCAIEEAVTDGDTLRLTVSYGGGCEDHEFKLVAWNFFMESFPVQAGIEIAHNGNNDLCDAYITEELSFDLTPLKKEYQDQYPDAEGQIVLQIGDLSVDYTF